MGARVNIVAGAAVDLGGIRAIAGRWIADTRHVALAVGGTCHRTPAHTTAGLAGIGEGAGVRVVAAASVRFNGVGAAPGGRVADAGIVALTNGCARDGVASYANAILAGIGQRASVRVIARAAVRLGWA